MCVAGTVGAGMIVRIHPQHKFNLNDIVCYCYLLLVLSGSVRGTQMQILLKNGAIDNVSDAEQTDREACAAKRQGLCLRVPVVCSRR